MKNIFIGIFLTSFWILTSCTNDFQEINTNPNYPEQLKQTELLLPEIFKSTAKDYFHNTLMRANIVCDYHEDPFTCMFGSAFDGTDTERYYFSSLNSVQTVIDSAKISNQPHLLGIGYTIKSWMFQTMTDLYGDFPYSEALRNKSDGIRYPAYDTQEEIYYDILDRLEEANTLLSQKSFEVISKDILLGGNSKRWRMFANGLQVRMLMRISGKNGLKIDVAKKLQEIVANPQKYPLPESYRDNIAFTFLNEEGNYAPSYTLPPASFTTSRFLSKTLEINLKSLSDPRIHIYASPTKKSVEQGNLVYAGVPSCLNEGDEMKFNGGDDFNSSMGILFLNRNIDKKLASPTAAQAIFLTHAEVQLHLAEAREKGLISAGEAATYYRAGIESSFAYWASRIPDNFTFPKASDILPDSAYYVQPGVAYSGTPEEKLQKVYIQKWLALYFCGFEGWSEWRRTGFPKQISVTPPAPYQTNSSIAEWPRRITYPMFEQNFNNASYRAAVARQGADNLTTRVWWNE